MPEMNRDEIAKLEALYASNPEGRVFTHLAEAYRKAGEFDRARAILEQGLSKHPGYASAYVVLGRVFFDLSDMEPATDSFRRVLELDPHNLVALRSLGDIARAAGRRDEALGYFQELRHQDPSNAEIENIIAQLREAPAPAAAPLTQPEPDLAPPAPPVYAVADEEVSAAVEPEAPAPFEETTPVPVAENLPEFDIPAPDYGDLVSSELDLGWTSDAPTGTEEALPGDLADFASLMESQPEPEPEPEPLPELPALESSDPAAEEDLTPIPELPSPTGEVLTETMAMLYRDQGLYERSAEVYRALLRDRPGDWSLQAGLHEVERLANEANAPVPAEVAPEAPPAFEPEPVEEPLPFIATASESAAPEVIETDEATASPWVTGGMPAPATPGMYAWADEPKEEEPQGAPIGEYFRSLLAWKPNGSSAQSHFAPAPEVESEPEMLELDIPADSAREPLFEEPVLPATPEAAAEPLAPSLPPAIPAEELMPWEEPASPSMPDAPVAPAPAIPAATPAATTSESPVDAAFDEWFNAATPAAGANAVDPLPSLTQPVQPAGNAPQPAAPTSVSTPVTPALGSNDSGDDDDDLEMFRSWLQSLKK
jgi:tetratricopeptide (TPR) repeat protein